MTPYRAIKYCPQWLARLSFMRGFRWYRRRVGGTWVLLYQYLLSGSEPWWHSELIDAPVRTQTIVLDREEP